jgi:hypothetical protein
MSLSRKDLIEICDQCGGSGNAYRAHPKGSENYGRQIEPVSSSEECLSCKGTGERITASGEAILDMLGLARELGKLKDLRH